ncbi:HYDIN protein, partial [Scytalopus superciliaris]|nr:HYDIN protein [Scytalopus superciliaris]
IFQVSFQSANLPVGEVDVVLPIKVPQLLGQEAAWAQQQMSPGLSAELSVLFQVARGPTIHIHLHATVVQLALTVSRNRVQFSEVQVGQCQVETVRLYNRFKVPCHWSVTVNKPAKKVKHSQH